MYYKGDGTNLHAPGAELGATHERLSALLAKVAAGDGAGMAALYDETSPFIYGLLTRMLGAGTVAEETLVEVYSRVWRKAASYSPAGGSPIAWLVTTARECALRKNFPDDAGRKPPEASKLPAHDKAARAREALGALCSKQKEALQLSYFNGLSQVEATFGLSTKESRSLVADALKSYAEMLTTRRDG